MLAWKIKQDDRPLRVESCLAMRVLPDGGGFSLARLYRHPHDEKPEWRLSMTHATGGEAGPTGRWYFHSTRFERRPTNKDVYAAMRFQEVNWSFELEEGWRFVGCGVCEASWRLVTGEPPTRFFGK